jgi:hypothetical protein
MALATATSGPALATLAAGCLATTALATLTMERTALATLVMTRRSPRGAQDGATKPLP